MEETFGVTAISRDLWLNNKWPLQTRPLAWLIEKFAPTPGWHEPIGEKSLAHIMALRGQFNGH